MFTFRQRKLPSGKPDELSEIVVSHDPTWLEEHKFFLQGRENQKEANLQKDLWISQQIHKLASQI